MKGVKEFVKRRLKIEKRFSGGFPEKKKKPVMYPKKQENL